MRNLSIKILLTSVLIIISTGLIVKGNVLSDYNADSIEYLNSKSVGLEANGDLITAFIAIAGISIFVRTKK